MTTRAKAGSRILDAVHETARDLHAAGFIDMRTMQKYDALCLEPHTHVFKREDSRASRATQVEPGRVGHGAQHQPLNRPSVGNRRQATQRTVAEALEPFGQERPGSPDLTPRHNRMGTRLFAVGRRPTCRSGTPANGRQREFVQKPRRHCSAPRVAETSSAPH